jgi:hypothetical protein
MRMIAIFSLVMQAYFLVNQYAKTKKATFALG